MSKNDISALKNFQKKIENLAGNMDDFYVKAARELALRVLSEVIPDTPVSPNTKNRRGGTLRRGWIGQEGPGSTPGQSAIASYAKSLSVPKSGLRYSVTISNGVSYAPYVEYGHRTRGGARWVPGQHMLENAVNRVDAIKEPLVKKLLKEYINDKLK